MSFLNLKNKTFLISGVSNKKSIATFVAKELTSQEAQVILTVQNDEAKTRATKIFPDADIYILDVSKTGEVKNFGKMLQEKEVKLDGFLHSMAFANYSEGIKPYHETKFNDLMEAIQISCFSLTSISNAIKDSLKNDASVVTVSISNTKATNYGYMGPIKAMLDSSIAYLAKSFSVFSNIRFNAVCSGPLKTSASAGIPGYIENYLFAEQLTMRHQALKTQEVADVISFLLSSRSSGVNASGIVVDAGMNANYFDEKVVEKFNQL